MNKLNLSLDEGRCWECGDDVDHASGLCLTCGPGAQIVPIDKRPVRASIYGTGSVEDMLTSLHASGAIMEVDDEIAALADTALKLMGYEHLHPIERGMSEKDRLDSLRQTLTSIVTAKDKRQTMMEREGYNVSVETFQVFLAEVLRILRNNITDPQLLQDIGLQLAKVSIRFKRTARAA